MTPIASFRRQYDLSVRKYVRVEILGGFRMDSTNEFTNHVVEVEIDLRQLVQTLGRKAIENKSGRARSGFVTVKHVKKGGK